MNLSTFGELSEHDACEGHDAAADLGAVVGGCRGDMEHQKMVRRVDGQTQKRPQIMGKSREAACLQPADRLLVDRRPWWQGVGHGAPRNGRRYHATQRAEGLAQDVFALPARLRKKRRIRATSDHSSSETLEG